MNRSNAFSSNAFFKPASQYLSPTFETSPNRHRRSDSIDREDVEHGMLSPSDAEDRLSRKERQRASELTPRSIPLIDLSRSRSPLARIRSAAQSEDEDEFEVGDAAQSRPLVAKDIVTGGQKKIHIFQRGGLGQFLFGTAIGWQVYIAILVFWVGGCQFGTLLMNRFILWTGTYK